MSIFVYAATMLWLTFKTSGLGKGQCTFQDTQYCYSEARLRMVAWILRRKVHVSGRKFMSINQQLSQENLR